MLLTLILIQVLSASAIAPQSTAEAAGPHWRDAGLVVLPAEWSWGGLYSVSLVDADTHRSGFPVNRSKAVRGSGGFDTVEGEPLPSDRPSKLSASSGPAAAPAADPLQQARLLSGNALSGEILRAVNRNQSSEFELPAAFESGESNQLGHLSLAYYTPGFAGFSGSFTSGSAPFSSGGGGDIGGGIPTPPGGVTGGLPGDGEGGGGRPRITPEPASLSMLALLGVALTHRPKRRR